MVVFGVQFFGFNTRIVTNIALLDSPRGKLGWREVKDVLLITVVLIEMSEINRDGGAGNCGELVARDDVREFIPRLAVNFKWGAIEHGKSPLGENTTE